MAWMKRTAVGLVVAALLAGTAAAVYVQRSFAVVDGKLQVSGLQAPVTVQRDASDVTHISAQSPQDVWFAMGYVHAQERTWQLEFNRRVMHGQLSEVFGAATLETDKLMRALDIAGAARRQYEGLPAYAREALQAYSQGINAFHKDRPQALPPEFHILRVTPGGAAGKVWEPEDSVGWALMRLPQTRTRAIRGFRLMTRPTGAGNRYSLWSTMPTCWAGRSTSTPTAPAPPSARTATTWRSTRAAVRPRA